MIVMKFGGTSLGTNDSIRRIADIIKKNKDYNPYVVVSALNDTTDMLIEAGKKAELGAVDFKKITNYHQSILKQLSLSSNLLDADLKRLGQTLVQVSIAKQLTKKLYALVVSFGELMSSKIVAAFLTSSNLKATQYNAFDLGLITSPNFEEADVLAKSYDLIKSKTRKIKDEIPIIAGFIAKDEAGNITTLGRGGSDYTASIFAAALQANQLQIWTDVDGIMSADPRIVPNARVIPEISFDEASELAYFGARVLHPKTILPAVKHNIPVRVLNSFNLKSNGTLIMDSPKQNSQVLAITHREKITAIKVSSPKMLSAYGFLRSIFKIFADNEVSVDIVATTEVSVSITVDSNCDISAIHALLSELGTVTIVNNRSSVSIIGSGLKNSATLCGLVFQTLSDFKIPTEIISAGASNINLSFVVKNEYAKKAVTQLHRVIFEGTEIILNAGISPQSGGVGK